VRRKIKEIKNGSRRGRAREKENKIKKNMGEEDGEGE
jgi:hypothetical protein